MRQSNDCDAASERRGAAVAAELRPANARPVLAGRWRDWVEVTGTDPRESPARCVTGCGIVSVWAAFPPPFSAALMGLSPAPAGLFLRGLPCGVQPTVIWCLWFAIFRIPGNPMERPSPASWRGFFMRVLRALRGRELFQLRRFWSAQACSMWRSTSGPGARSSTSCTRRSHVRTRQSHWRSFLQSGSQSPLVGAALLISRPWAVRDV